MKRARPAKGKGKQVAQVEQLSGAEALRIKETIDAGRQPDLATLLSLLNSASPCEELYSASCKVGHKSRSSFSYSQSWAPKVPQSSTGARAARGSQVTRHVSTQGKGGNPNCLCGLIPNPGSTRRAGLWAKQPGAVAELGPDPATLKREVRLHCSV
jgi:hypothetical protein